jgi:hypothetical protein
MLEYIKDPCFIQPKSGMKVARYSHSVIHDSKRARVYIFGGIGEERTLTSSSLLEDEDDNQSAYFTKSCEYYDLRTDIWV